MNKFPVALQVYSIRDEAQADFKTTMAKVKEMGYDGVELAGLYGQTAEEVRDTLKKIGLIPISAHVPFEDLAKNLSRTVEQYATLGCRYIAIPYLSESFRYGADGFEEVLARIPDIAKECAKYGITLLYHNHDFEFAKTAEGSYVLDYLFAQFAKEQLQTEIDTCWVKVAGEDPVKYLQLYSGRSPIIHLKDFEDHPFELCHLGKGIQDVPAILKGAAEAGSVWVVVEQDSHSAYTPLEDSQLSREYLRSLGI